MSARVSLTLTVAMAAGVFGQILARHVRMPAIVLLLAIGVALGPEGLGWVRPRALGQGLAAWVHFAVALILFEGGLNLEADRLRDMQKSLRRLIFGGGLVTWLGAAAAAHVFLGWSPSLCFLFGSLVVVTGPTVIAPLMRGLRFRNPLRSMLEAEGVLIDPVGALLAALMLQVALAPQFEAVGLATAMVALRFLVGLGVGAACGAALARALNHPRLVPHGLENVLTLGVVVLLFHAADALLSHSGIVAVTVAGVVVGNAGTRVDRDLREFKDQITLLLVGFVFVLLAADLRLDDIADLGTGGWLVVATLILVVRPAAVLLSTWGSEIPGREKLMLAWIAPRGIVAAAVATTSAAALGQEEIAGGEALRAMVFLTIVVTVVLAGLTAGPLGSMLGLRLGARRTVAILGAGEMALAVGEELRRAGRPVVFLDADPGRFAKARERGFPAVLGDALREHTALLAGIEEVESAIAMTSNDHLNTLFARYACEVHRVPRAFVALSGSGSGSTLEQLRRFGGKVLFEAPHDRMRWEVRWRHGEVDVLRLALAAADSAQGAGGTAKSGGVAAIARGDGREPWVVLGYRRGQAFEPMTRATTLEPGDEVVLAVHRPQREAALVQLAEAGLRETAGQGGPPA